MRKDDLVRLKHMADAAREAISFAKGRSRADLDTDRMLVLSLVKEIEIIGEAASKVSQETRNALPDIPWVDLTGMRHRLIHAYFDINVEIVWQTIVQDLPPLLSALERVLQEDSSNPA